MDIELSEKIKVKTDIKLFKNLNVLLDPDMHHIREESDSSASNSESDNDFNLQLDLKGKRNCRTRITSCCAWIVRQYKWFVGTDNIEIQPDQHSLNIQRLFSI